MKKISFLFAALATTMGFTSCDESKDDHPVLQPNEGVVVENFLNTPEMTNMSVELTEENANNYLHMTCSQPSYGYAATVRYDVEVSFSPDFSTPAVPGAPASTTLATPFYDCSEVNPTYGELATAMCDLLAITDKQEIPTGYHDIYARLNANIEVAGGADVYPNTAYQSNIVKLTRANCTYLAVILPGQPTGIYLRGGWDLSWNALPEYEFLTTEENSVTVIESCTIAEGTEFKVADANWAVINMGGTCGVVTDITLGEKFELNTDPANGGPGNLRMPVDFTGRVTLTEKNGSYTLLFEAAEPDTPDQPTGVYLRGGWDPNWDALPAYQFLTTNVKNVWLVKGVSIAAGTEFKVADDSWGSMNLGGAADSKLEIGKAFTLVSGGANIICPSAFTGDVEVKLQGGAYILTLIAL